MDAVPLTPVMLLLMVPTVSGATNSGLRYRGEPASLLEGNGLTAELSPTLSLQVIRMIHSRFHASVTVHMWNERHNND